MTLKKRLLTASAAAVFAVSVLPFAAFADDEPAPTAPQNMWAVSSISCRQ